MKSARRIKLGVVAGIGQVASDVYRKALHTADFFDIDTEAFLCSNERGRGHLIYRAAKQLEAKGCTHAAVACFSYQGVGFEEIAKTGLTAVADMRELLKDRPRAQRGRMCIAHSRAVPELRAMFPAAGFLDRARQALLDRLIDEVASHFVREDTNGLLQMLISDARRTIIACTDIRTEHPGALNLTTLHLEQLQAFLKESK